MKARSGSVRRLASGRWQVRVSAGRVDGRRAVRTCTVATEGDAAVVLAGLLGDVGPVGGVVRAVPRERLPFGPLGALVAAQVGPGCVFSVIARRLGVRRETVHRWAVAGVPWVEADRAAVEFGRHPGELWPGWWVVPM